jgi:AraC-like DNA-binding protein
MQEIASASGFSSHDSLARAIQKAHGVTPLKLRKNLRLMAEPEQLDNPT